MLPDIKRDLGQLLSVGFGGTSISDDGVQQVLAQARAGVIGGVILYRYNIENPVQLKELLSHFVNVESRYPLFIMIDQEGGKVQRIGSAKGFKDSLSAQKLAQELSIEEALQHYRQMGEQLSEYGFNFNFAPCVDVDGDPPCDVIGKLERSYSSDPSVVTAYAETMIQALRAHGVASCIKHFPGHGSARADSHMGLVDITGEWQERELNPYRELAARGAIDSIMSAHLIHNQVDKDTPVVFSRTWLDRIRNDIGFDGVIVTDDLHMGAIVHNFSLHDIAVRTINAGHDLLIFSNNPLASKTQGIRHDESSSATAGSALTVTVPDPLIAEKIIQEIEDAHQAGVLTGERLQSAITRVLKLKEQIRR